jgi:thioredoxin-like negative regulator of GroEL
MTETGDIIEIDDKSWEKIIEKGKNPALVMFYSTTCSHCKNMDPYFNEYAKGFRGQMVFAKLNIAENPYTATRYGVMGTPTFKFFCQGRPVHELVGAVYPSLLKKAVEEVLHSGNECAKKSTKIDYSITGYA